MVRIQFLASGVKLASTNRKWFLLSFLLLDHLLGSPITHEMMIGEDPCTKKKGIGFNVATGSKKA